VPRSSRAAPLAEGGSISSSSFKLTGFGHEPAYKNSIAQQTSLFAINKTRMTKFFKQAFMTIAALAMALVNYTYAGTGLFMREAIQLPAMRTHCIGRYLIDLPEEYAMTPGSELELYYGLGKDFERVKVQLSRQQGDQPTLEKMIRKVSGDLQSEQHFKSPSKNMLAGVNEISQSTILVRAYDDQSLLNYFRFHLYALRGEAIARFEGFNYTDSRRTPEYIEKQLIEAAQNTTYAAKPESAGRGTCLGSVVVDAKQDGEVFRISFLSKQHPDAKIAIDMNSLPEKGDGGLLQRVDSKAGMLRLLDFSSSTLRRGKRPIAGRPGEELLDTGKDKGKVVRYFVAETLVTEPSSPARPVIAISMNMGGQDKDGEYIDPSLSEREALAWWDAIVGSIRLRPGAF